MPIPNGSGASKRICGSLPVATERTTSFWIPGSEASTPNGALFELFGFQNFRLQGFDRTASKSRLPADLGFVAEMTSTALGRFGNERGTHYRSAEGHAGARLCGHRPGVTAGPGLGRMTRIWCRGSAPLRFL